MSWNIYWNIMYYNYSVSRKTGGGMKPKKYKSQEKLKYGES